MSIGGDEYDEQGRTGGGTDASAGRVSTRGTRTRLPGEDGDVYGVGRRPGGQPGRSLLMIVAVVVLLIAAIAFANRGGTSGSDGDQADGKGGGGAHPTVPTGERPVDAEDGTTGIPSGFAHTEQGAQSAAANYAVALVSAEIIQPDARGLIIGQVFAPSRVDEMHSKMDDAYSSEFLDKMGLEEDGTAKDGMTYVSRTAPIGTDVVSYENGRAKVDVWCTGVFGTSGGDSTNPVTSDWFTMSFELLWTDGDWRVQHFAQEDGPAPVNGDNRASSADEIADAVEQYGGFTYAR